jgi:hypothetical protein
MAAMTDPQPTAATETKGNSMKPTFRYRSQIFFRLNARPNRVIRIKPAKLNFIFRPARFGLKPKIIPYEHQS